MILMKGWAQVLLFLLVSPLLGPGTLLGHYDVGQLVDLPFGAAPMSIQQISGDTRN
jgi:hypothetical protein